MSSPDENFEGILEKFGLKLAEMTEKYFEKRVNIQ